MKIRQLVAIVMAAILAYPLSVGPVLFIYHRMSPNTPSPEIFSIIYGPLLWLCSKSGTFAKVYFWYSNL